MYKVFKEGELKNMRQYVLTQRCVLVKAFGVFIATPSKNTCAFMHCRIGPFWWLRLGARKAFGSSKKLHNYKLKIFRYKLRIQCIVYGHIKNLEASVYAEHVFSENVQTIGIFS